MQRYIHCFRGCSIIAALLVCSIVHLASAASEQPCCITLPPAPGNEADALVRTMYGIPFGAGVPPEYSIFVVDIHPGGGGSPTPPIPPGRYAAWCFDPGTSLPTKQEVGIEYGGMLYSTCDPEFLANPLKFLPPRVNWPNLNAEHWKQINYLINHRRNPCNGAVATMWEVQHAIFQLFGLTFDNSGFPPYDPVNVGCLVSEAVSKAPSWQPKVGDKLAVVYNIDVNWDANKEDVQLIFLEVPCTEAPPQCDVSVALECVVPAVPPAGGFDCSGAKPIDTLWVRWNGVAPVWVKAWNGAVGTGTSTTFGPVNKGDKVTFKRTGTFPNDVYFELFSAADMTTASRLGLSTFHLSCSDDDMDGPEDCGKAAGNGKTTLATYINDWIFEGLAGNGKSFECTPTPPQPSTNCSVTVKPMASCDTLGKPTSLTFRYTGGGCGGNNPQSGKFICSGAVDTLQPVTVASANGYSISPVTVAPGGEFTVSTSSFSAQSLFTLTNAGGTQSLSIHTSCSQPLAVGDVFGNLTLVGFNGQMGGTTISLRYTVKNGTPATQNNVYLTDSKLGPIAGPFTLLGNETKVFTMDLQVNGSISSVATVTVQGKPCSATSNQVVVNVLESCPTPVPIGPTGVVCSDIKPIDSITMQWDGTQTIRVVAWKGTVGSGAPLATIASVSPGQIVTVSGYAGSPNDVYWEIFAADPNGPKLGESTFHLSCSDSDMNGPEDCGKAQGDGKARLGFINQWIFKGMSGNGKSIDCTGSQPLAKATIKDKKLLWTLANSGPTSAVMTKVTATWPAANGRLLKVKLDGDVVWDDKSAAGATSVTLDDAVFTKEAKKKSIGAGDTRVFTLEFEHDASSNLSDYTLSIAFGSCVLNL